MLEGDMNTQKNSKGEPLPKSKYLWVSNLLFPFLIPFKSLWSSSLLSLWLKQFSCCLPLFKCIYFIIQRLLLILQLLLFILVQFLQAIKLFMQLKGKERGEQDVALADKGQEQPSSTATNRQCSTNASLCRIRTEDWESVSVKKTLIHLQGSLPYSS